MLDNSTGNYYIVPLAQLQNIVLESVPSNHNVIAMARVSNSRTTYSIQLGTYPDDDKAQDMIMKAQAKLTEAFMSNENRYVVDSNGRACIWIQFHEEEGF